MSDLKGNQCAICEELFATPADHMIHVGKEHVGEHMVRRETCWGCAVTVDREGRCPSCGEYHPRHPNGIGREMRKPMGRIPEVLPRDNDEGRWLP